MESVLIPRSVIEDLVNSKFKKKINIKIIPQVPQKFSTLTPQKFENSEKPFYKRKVEIITTYKAWIF